REPLPRFVLGAGDRGLYRRASPSKPDLDRRRSDPGEVVGVKWPAMHQRRTKIIATVGPSQDPPGALERLLDTGVDLLRVNLSHAGPRDQASRVRRARAHRPDVAVLVALAGPKLRLADLPADLVVKEGEALTLGAGGVPVGDPSLYERVH